MPSACTTACAELRLGFRQVTGLREADLTRDGARYVCRPGDVIFAEDTAGKGHITRSLRDTRSFVHMAMPEDFDVLNWPLIT